MSCLILILFRFLFKKLMNVATVIFEFSSNWGPLFSVTVHYFDSYFSIANTARYFHCINVVMFIVDD